MALNGLLFPTMTSSTINNIEWNPPNGDDLAIEVMRISDLLKRATIEHFQQPQRVSFFMLMAVTQGQSVHVVDFVKHPLRSCSWLILHPGQMQRFDFSNLWDGWLIAFRPDFLVPRNRLSFSPYLKLSDQLAGIPTAASLSKTEHQLCCSIVQQMANDASLKINAAERNELMYHQVCHLLLRLRHVQQHSVSVNSPPESQNRVQQFRLLTEKHYRFHHNVSWFAKQMACTVKTLTRSTHAILGISAKKFLSERIALEAKRQLVHSNSPIEEISYSLGFEDTSHFIKFFKQQTKTTPGRFRSDYGGK